MLLPQKSLDFLTWSPMGNKHYSNFYIGQNGSKSSYIENCNRVFARKGNCVILLPPRPTIGDLGLRRGIESWRVAISCVR